MSSTREISWLEANQRHLMASVARVRARLERHGADDAPGPATAEPDGPQSAADGRPFALDSVITAFGLSMFERDLLLLAAGIELDASFADSVAAASRGSRHRQPTFSLAMAALEGAHWSAITPAAPLRRWRLIDVLPGDSLTTSPLRIDETVLHYLTGTPYVDERLAPLLDPIEAPASLVTSHARIAEMAAAVWIDGRGEGDPIPTIQLVGDDPSSLRSVAAAITSSLSLGLRSIAALRLPQLPAELETLQRIWERDAALSASALLIDATDIDTSDPTRERAIAKMLEQTSGAVIIASRERRHSAVRRFIGFDIGRPTPQEQRELWRSALGADNARLNGAVDRVVSQFSMSAGTIDGVLGRLRSLGGITSSEREGRAADAGRMLWDACRDFARPRLDDLAQRIEPAAQWEDLVLPEPERELLRQIAAHVRQRSKVYEEWGFAGKGKRGLGISALFAGASGTGKTMAAEVLAGQLGLDLYRIDLSSVVSKYIGETEKNLRRLFDAAESGGVVLLFDEADALFGKRSEVKDSHDRYANIEVSYLLQRMESYRGLAILTTNLKSALDTAFLRRIRFVVQFPFPDAAQRAEIWSRIFPSDTPVEDLDTTRLARLDIAGGNIRNIALNGAFLAADSGEPVMMKHLLTAAKSEFTKLERPLSDSEMG
jgi:hypothetical protein